MDRKRALALILALVLLVSLLAGCDQLRPAKEKTKKTTEPSGEVVPTEPAPTETAAPRPRAADVGGVSIYIDDSKYARYQPEEEICTPLPNGTMDRFVPSLDYGDVFPYVAGRLYTSTEDGYSWAASQTYGLADSKGRMLTGGIYSGAYPLYCSTPHYYAECMPYLIVSRYTDWEVTHYTSEYGEWDDITASSERALIAMDGTMMIPFGMWSFQGFPDCILATRQTYDDYMPTGRQEFVVYDLQGEPLFYSADLPFDRNCDSLNVRESEGVLMVSQYYYSDETGEKNVVDYYDLSGRHILGPYRNGSLFCDGLACVSLEGTYYGYIDKSGDWVIPREYLSCEDFRNGVVGQKTKDGLIVLLDTAGNRLVSTTGEYYYLQEDLFSVSYGYSYSYGYGMSYGEYYDFTGRLLCRGYLDAYKLGGGAYATREQSGGVWTVTVHDPDHPEKVVTIPDCTSNFIKTAAVVDGQLVYGYAAATEQAGGKICLIDYDTQEIFEIPLHAAGDDVSSAVSRKMDSFYSQGKVRDPLTGTEWFLVKDKGGWVLFDAERNQVFRFASDAIPSVMNGYITALTETACTVYDTAGTAVFRRRLDAED